MNKRSVPPVGSGGIGTRRNNLEKNLSAKQHLQEEDSRFQASHENEERKADPEKKARQGQKAVNGLIFRKQDLTFPRSAKVRSRTDYLRIQRSGRKTGGRYLILLSMDNNLPASRFGITVSRKTGNAVTRNRTKRRIREIQRLSRDMVVPGKDIVVIATREASTAEFEDMKTEYSNLISRAGLARAEAGR
jgi:ribonuclease P protein component